MVIDKRNGNVAFSESDHVYFDVTNPKKEFISVTTLIHRYVEPFDGVFWSSYKVLEGLLPPVAWQEEKKALMASRKFDEGVLERYGIPLDVFLEKRQGLLDQWDRNAREASERGTRMHAELENSFYEHPRDISLRKFGLGGGFSCDRGRCELDMEMGVYPEYLVHYGDPDGVFNLAGQIDLLVKEGNSITVVDNKFTKRIDRGAGGGKFRKMMLYPLNALPDTNYWHYSMQLSMYAWMVQQMDPSFVVRDLMINHYDKDLNNDVIHVDYLKDEVERMLAHYKAGLRLKGRRESRKAVAY